MTESTDQPADVARWRGYSHKELYLMLHDGPGAGASAEPSRRWAEIAATLTEIGEDLQKAVDSTGAGWTGRAAGSAYDRLASTVTWASETGASAAVMRTSVEDQGDHVAKARADMPKPEDVPAATTPDPTVAPAVAVIAAQTDLEPAEANASSAEERAVEVMAAYEVNTNTTTGAMASFVTPRELFPSTDSHHIRGGGLLGILPTVVSGLLGSPSRDDDHRANDRGHNRGNGWNSPSTSGASAEWHERRSPGLGPVGPGKTTGVSMGSPILAPGMSARSERNSSAKGNGGSGGNNNSGGGGGGNQPGAGSRSGSGSLPQTTHELQQAAAASQAAANPAGGAPMAPGAAGAPVGGTQDKLGMRRFGMEAIGSSQWFGDADEPVVGQTPKRRFDLRDGGDVTEPVSILDEEHKLPPTVIGDGPTR